jgi:Cysteine-rich secretory protein family
MGRVVALLRGVARGLALFLAAMLVVVLAPVGAHASSSSDFAAKINAARTSRGGHALAVRADLNAVAQAQANRMASASDLFHNPNLGGSVSHWTSLAENVGYGPDVATIHTAFMNSPGHRTNILNGKYTEVGVGVVVRNHVMWVAEVFRTPSGSSNGSSGASKPAGGGSTKAKTNSTPTKAAAPAPNTATKAQPPAKAPAKTVNKHKKAHKKAPKAKPAPAPRPAASHPPALTRAVAVFAASAGSSAPAAVAAGDAGSVSDAVPPAAAATLLGLALIALLGAARLRLT